MRASALATAVLYLPYYLLAIPGLLRGEGLGKAGGTIRQFAWVYAVGMFLNMSIVLAIELQELMANSPLAPRLGYYWIPCGLYWVVPLLVLIRLQKEDATTVAIKEE